MTAAWEQDLVALVADRERALVGYAYVLCGDLRHAEDLVQEALVRVFSRLRRASAGNPEVPAAMRAVHVDDGPLTFTEAYVRKAVLNLYLDEWRRRKKWAELTPLVAVDDRVRFPDSGVTTRADIARALTTLSPRQRACVVLRYFEDLTVLQIAEALGVAPGTVKRYLSEAVHSLRGVLRPEPSATGRTAVAEEETR